jgi:hypothetical protein
VTALHLFGIALAAIGGLAIACDLAEAFRKPPKSTRDDAVRLERGELPWSRWKR